MTTGTTTDPLIPGTRVTVHTPYEGPKTGVVQYGGDVKLD